jgi:diadenosine tetraphosphate (Ap4A) HIT family hydrolase
MRAMTDCPLCVPADPALLLWAGSRCRVVAAADPDHPGFCRVVWHRHVAELTDLLPADRAHVLAVVGTVEAVLRRLLRPDKVNVASLGNQVPHLHWHVIPRYRDDAHFPDAVWAPRRRTGVAPAVDVAAIRSLLSMTLPRD